MYNPLKLNGEMSCNDRWTNINKFQEANNNYRLLIGNVQVCSSGIDLDDKNGGFPRFCLVSPNFSTITLYQLSHRFQRANTMSYSTIHFVYSKNNKELSILDAIARKGKIMKEVTNEQTRYGVLFPTDYGNFVEE